MNSFKKSTLLALAISLLSAFAFSGCNTMKGLGKDTERAGEKIQDKASR
jgi:predicted small secreted protein